jgi:hypothetical protein
MLPEADTIGPEGVRRRMSEPTVALLAEIRDLLAGLPAAIAAAVGQQSVAQPRLLQKQLAEVVPLLQAIVSAPNPPFTARVLAERAKSSAALEATLASTGPHRVGRLLRRAADCGVAGFVVVALGSTRHGALWRVQRYDHAATVTASFA